MALHRINKGLDLPLAGDPVQAIEPARAVDRVALLGADYHGMRPTLLVQGGRPRAARAAAVRGQEDARACSTRRRPPAPSPRSTAARCAPSSRWSSTSRRTTARTRRSPFASYRGAAGRRARRRRRPRAAGRIRPVDGVAHPAVQQGAGAATRRRTRSSSPRSTPARTRRRSRSCSPAARPISPPASRRWRKLCAARSSSAARRAAPLPGEADGRRPWSRSSPARIRPAPPGCTSTCSTRSTSTRAVWHIGYQDVAAIGRLLATGKLDVERVIALAGPGARRARGCCARAWARRPTSSSRGELAARRPARDLGLGARRPHRRRRRPRLPRPLPPAGQRAARGPRARALRLDHARAARSSRSGAWSLGALAEVAASSR